MRRHNKVNNIILLNKTMHCSCGALFLDILVYVFPTITRQKLVFFFISGHKQK